VGYRAGYYERGLITGVGKIELRVRAFDNAKPAS